MKLLICILLSLPMISILTAVSSCSQQNPSIDHDKAREVVRNYILADGIKDSSIKEVDTVNIYNVEYLTPRHDSQYVANIIGYRLYIDSAYELQKDSMELKSELKEAIQQNEEAKKSIWLSTCDVCEKMAENDLHNYYAALRYRQDFKPRYDKIIKLWKENKIDTTTHNGYVLYYSYKGADFENKEIKKDSLWLFINSDYRIVKHEYYDDEPYEKKYDF